jgi:predicted RecA/RadA family phage recombinase
MAQKIQNGEVITIVAVSTAIETGDVVIFDDIIGVSQMDAKVGELCTIDTVGVYKIPCKASTDFTVGTRVTYDTSNGVITDDGVDGTHVNAGIIWEDYSQATGDGSVLVKING